MPPATIDPKVHARRWKTLAVLALSLLIIGLDNTVLNVALPTLQSHFSASGTTLIMPATLSVIMDIFPREERAKAIGIWSAVAGLGIGLGPFIGGLLLEWFSWASVFWLNVPIGGVALVAGYLLVPESRDRNPGAFDLPGAGLSIAMLVTLVYGIIEATPRGWTDSLVLGCFAAAAVLGALFVWWERRVDAPTCTTIIDPPARRALESVGASTRRRATRRRG